MRGIRTVSCPGSAIHDQHAVDCCCALRMSQSTEPSRGIMMQAACSDPCC